MSRLPAGLSPWEESLAGLDRALAVALGPMLHILDELVGRLDDRGADVGDPDGFDGTATRGSLDRLLLSEWALADEVPVEFLRRAAEHELTYLRPAHRAAAPRGRVLAICDGGPEQLGVGRLVQIAALVVLDRRARQGGTTLAGLVLQDGQVVDQPLPGLLRHWLRSRSNTHPTAEQVELAMATTTDEDQVWVLAGPRTRGLVPRHRRTLVSSPSAWSSAGVSEVAVRVGDSSARLAVPSSPAAVAALRGGGLLARDLTSSPTSRVSTTGQGAVFGSIDTRVLWRGSTDREVLGCYVRDGDGSPARVRRFQLSSSVLAAASLGHRLVAVLTDGTRVWVEVVGKKLATTGRVDVRLTDLDIDAGALADRFAEPLRPVYLHGRQILLQVGDRWLGLEDDRVTSLDVDAVAPGTALDAPRLVRTGPGRLTIGKDSFDVPDLAAPPVLGPSGSAWRAWTEDTRVWTAASGRIRTQLAVEEGDRVVGLCLVAGEPALVVVSASTRIVRQVSEKRVKTWTRWAGPGHFEVHPVRPWLVRTTPEDIVVGDLVSGRDLLRIRADS